MGLDPYTDFVRTKHASFVKWVERIQVRTLCLYKAAFTVESSRHSKNSVDVCGHLRVYPDTHFSGHYVKFCLKPGVSALLLDYVRELCYRRAVNFQLVRYP